MSILALSPHKERDFLATFALGANMPIRTRFTRTPPQPPAYRSLGHTPTNRAYPTNLDTPLPKPHKGPLFQKHVDDAAAARFLRNLGLPTSPVVKMALQFQPETKRLRLVHSRPSTFEKPTTSGPPLRDLHPRPSLSRDAHALYWHGDVFWQFGKSRPWIDMTRDEDTLIETLHVIHDPNNRAEFEISFPHSLITGRYWIKGKEYAHKGDLIGCKGLQQAMRAFYDAYLNALKELAPSPLAMPGPLRTQIKALYEFTSRRVTLSGKNAYGLSIHPDAGDLATIEHHKGYFILKNVHPTYLIYVKSADGSNAQILFPGQDALLTDGMQIQMGIDREQKITFAKPFVFEDPAPIFHPLEIFDLMNWKIDLNDWKPLSMDDGAALHERIRNLFLAARLAGQEMGYASQVVPLIPIAVPQDARLTNNKFKEWLQTVYLLLGDEWMRHESFVGSYRILFISPLNQDAYWQQIKNRELKIH